MKEIEGMGGIRATALVNNTHMLKDTRKEDVIRGYDIVKQVSDKLGLEFRYNVAKKDLVNDIKKDPRVANELKEKLFPIDLYFRSDWMS